jgi:hypothetical protein
MQPKRRWAQGVSQGYALMNPFPAGLPRHMMPVSGIYPSAQP